MNSKADSTGDDQSRFLFAPHGLRAVAWFFDYVLVMAVVVFVLPQPVRFLVPLLLLIAYHALLTWLVQQTAGKALLGLRVRRIGHEPTFLWAVSRASAGYFIVDMLGIGLLTAFFDARRRCLHDFVFGSEVIFEGDESLRLKRFLNRLENFAKRQETALKEKKKSIAALIAFWTFLAATARILQRVIDHLVVGAKTPPPAGSVGGVLTAKAAAWIATAAVAVSTTIVIYLPSVRYTAEWFIAPRYFFVRPPPGWIKCSCPERHSGVGAFYNGERWHESDLMCDQAIFKR